MDDVERLLQKSRQLFEERLMIEGKTFERQVRKAGRLVPRGRRRDAALLVQAEAVAGHPKLARMTSGDQTRQAGDRLITWLETIDPKERRTTALLQRLAGIAFNLLIIIVVLLVVLRWRGFL